MLGSPVSRTIADQTFLIVAAAKEANAVRRNDTIPIVPVYAWNPHDTGPINRMAAFKRTCEISKKLKRTGAIADAEQLEQQEITTLLSR